MKCPVCDNVNTSMVCPRCGFDSSRDYGKYPTFGPVGRVTSVSGLRERRQGRVISQQPVEQQKPVVVHEVKPNTSSSGETGQIAFWMVLTYFFCAPAGGVVTIAYLLLNRFLSHKSNVVYKIMKVLCIIGTVIGLAIYTYAFVFYSHCDEAMYFSIIGLLTKLYIGDL